MPKPVLYPEWAMLDQPNPISGQQNVVVPPTEKMNYGWAFGEKPNRQWWNWLHRTTCDWIEYFDENLDFESDLFIPTWTGIDLPSIDQNTGYFTRDGDRVFININLRWGEVISNGSTVDVTLTNLPFLPKNIPTFRQSFHVSRGSSLLIPVFPTFAGYGIISAIINPNSPVMNIWQENPTTGIARTVNNSGPTGELIISGSYIVELP